MFPRQAPGRERLALDTSRFKQALGRLSGKRPANHTTPLPFVNLPHNIHHGRLTRSRIADHRRYAAIGSDGVNDHRLFVGKGKPMRPREVRDRLVNLTRPGAERLIRCTLTDAIDHPRFHLQDFSRRHLLSLKKLVRERIADFLGKRHKVFERTHTEEKPGKFFRR